MRKAFILALLPLALAGCQDNTEVDNLRALSLYYEAGFETWREARLYQKRL